MYSSKFQAGDATAVGKVAVQIVRSCWQARDLSQLNANILVIVKRRAQLKQAIAEMVQEAMTYIDQIPSRDDRLVLVSTLRTVTDGKVGGFYCEHRVQSKCHRLSLDIR